MCVDAPQYFSAMVRSPDGTIYQYRFSCDNIDAATQKAFEIDILKGYEIIRVHELGTDKPLKMGELVPFWK